MSFIGNIRALLNSRARDIRSTVTDEVGVEIGGNNIDAFGDIVLHEYTPLLQFDFVYGGGGSNGAYGATNQVGVSTSAGTGASVQSGSVTGSLLQMTSGTSAGTVTTTPTTSYAQFVSTRIARYRAGQAILARFTCVFGTAVANNNQIAGSGNTVDGYFFGYNDTTFGVLHRRNSSDTDPVAGWTPKTSWNVDVCDGSNSANNPSGFNLNPLLGNVYQIRYPYLGFGPIKFYVLNPATSLWVLVHIIKYPNSQTVVQITNPGLQFYAASYNTGAGGNSATLKCGSVGFFLSGLRTFLGPQFAINNQKSAVTTETNILTLQSATSYNGVTNRSVVRIRSLSIFVDGANGYANLRVVRGATLGGAPSYTPISGTGGPAALTSAQSIVTYDVAGTTVASGVNIFNANLARNTSFQIDMTPYDVFMLPGDTLTFAMTASASAACGVAVNWQEDQ